ncbi:uncharacterized protein EDB93DRAFT_456225 [Suillus bovinus]|uniref:uncharacterized protein n=1 Tax=Suillus bovinus TaxID=48563 RepID=UPI001B864604|nr:uncharacterized protein EDB93DRAFT_456225 [Suillus bovinus]KAG2146917.1 hypothetical protein EDB93DRAFT_456225 [Suillus bovinus]
MTLRGSAFEKNRAAVVPEAAPRSSGITKENLSDQSVHDSDEYQTQGRQSKPIISLESSISADTCACMPENPFADAEPSGDTPSSATREDPMHDIVKYSHGVTAEHKPRVARVSGIDGAWPERAEIVNSTGGFPRPTICRGTFSQAKAFFLRPSASGGYAQGAISQRTRSQDNPIKDKNSTDYFKVDIPRARSLNGGITCDPNNY